VGCVAAHRRSCAMPNAATRRRRRANGLPTNCARVRVSSSYGGGDFQEYVMTRVFADTTCTSRFLVLRNCPYVLMSWLQALLCDEDTTTAYRMERPFHDMVVWIFPSVVESGKAICKFYQRPDRECPWYVPPHVWSLDIPIFQLFNDPTFLQRF
jgi:hypothetical protein